MNGNEFTRDVGGWQPRQPVDVQQQPVGAGLDGAWGLVLAMLLPFAALVLLFWVLGKVPQGAGGTAFVPGPAIQ